MIEDAKADWNHRREAAGHQAAIDERAIYTEAEADAAEALRKTAPTTLPGLLALIRYASFTPGFLGVKDGYEEWAHSPICPEEHDWPQLLATISASIEQLKGAAHG